MSNILNNYSLKNHNTFGVAAKAKYFASFSSEDQLAELLKDNICKTEPLFILGGGSNILLTQDFDGLVLANNIKGIEIITEDKKSTSIAVGAGEIWVGPCRAGRAGLQRVGVARGNCRRDQYAERAGKRIASRPGVFRERPFWRD